MSPRILEPVAVPSGRSVLELLPALRAALSGDGPALLPHAGREAPPAALAPGEPLGDAEDDPHDPTVAVVATSGSTGPPKGALLPASALLASASATHDRLGGPGHWLLALPAHHVAGLQVLLRSLVTGTEPTVLDLTEGFRAEAFTEAVGAMPGVRRYTALVPTQLRRLLAAGAGPTEALARLDAVLLGGACAPAPLLDRAAEAGVRVVTTYGMSETCGGCVYDHVPLDGVQVRVDGDGRVHLAGPVVARGYRGAGPASSEAFSTDPSGIRWFRTDDAGRLDPDGRLAVLGRLDDVIVTGGLKVSPGVVEAALLAMVGVAEAVVVGVPDDEWGQRVVAAIVPAAGCMLPSLDDVRREVGRRVGAHAAPHRLLVLDRLPQRGPGKPDRASVARLASPPT